jgi:SAM-dependent methyltransferase
MYVRDAGRLVAPAVGSGGTWADLGAGRGTFAAALARLLGPGGTVYAVERDESSARALDELTRRKHNNQSRIIVMRGDFTQPLALPALDGALLANALHFVRSTDQASLLRRVGGQLQRGGRIVVVEYDDRPPSRWVPFPVSLTRLRDLAREADLDEPRVIGRTGSAFGGTMYAAQLDRQ